MINFQQHTLQNGLKLIIHPDKSTPLAIINVLYNVGARDENPEKSGFAHLFEHLMFGGSINVPVFDKPLELVGGDNNAFTNNDITNYYLSLPADNIETGLWLESDRMLSLAFSENSLNVQRNVVIEEFKQRYLNQPYGDAWLKLRPMAYKKHPYRWPTIGREISHIENATMEDVKSFYKKFYNPNNAIITIAGNVDAEKVIPLVEKWFGKIPKGETIVRNLPIEPKQTKSRFEEIEGDVPFDAIYKVFHVGVRLSNQFYAADLISDILSNNESSRLFQQLVKNKKIFSEIDAYVTGDIDPGLLVINGKPTPNTSLETAEKALNEELEKLSTEKIGERELQKNKNKAESSHLFSEVSPLNKAMNLSYFSMLGNTNLINQEIENYLALSGNDIMLNASEILSPSNSSTLYYHKK